MNDMIHTQLKIIVERAVRPVQASVRHKRSLRQELLAHVSDVFEEELARLGDENAALKQASLRFGDPDGVKEQLQTSVPAADRFWSFFEGRPDESVLRGALRFACIETCIAWAALAVAFVAGSWSSSWSPDELLAVISSIGFVPFWLLMPIVMLCLALIAHWMEPALLGSEPLTGWPRTGWKRFASSAWRVPAVRNALVFGGGCAIVLGCIGGFRWPLHVGDWTQATGVRALLFVGALGAATVLGAWALVQTVAERRRRYEEWARLSLSAIEG